MKPIHPFCLETKGLSHRFSSSELVLNEINLQVPEGTIYGFLGPNGAGKTTTLRLVLGLLKSQTGSIYIFGKSLKEHRIDILTQIGSLIETPSIYAHLTAEENLSIWQIVYQCPGERIKQVLELVGLSQTGKKKAGKFSLGMKQRLSIAIALLHRPKLLILDEPTNGLDPNGIVEIRMLLKRLNEQEGITIIVSSHLLSEIEKMVTHIGIINNGNLLFQGKLDDLINQQLNKSRWVFNTSEPGRAKELLNANGCIIELINDELVLENVSKEKIAAINRELVANNIHVYGIGLSKNDLESVFVEIIK
jgi:lantibiotic transport system ATP-binding protein